MRDNIIISGFIDWIFKVWNVEIGECIYILYGYIFIVCCMYFYEKRVVSGF